MKIDPVYTEIGKLIQQKREAAGLTQAEFAARVSLSRASIANIETGRQKIFLHQLVTMAQHLGVDTSTLLLESAVIGEASPALPSDLSAGQMEWVKRVANG